MDGIFKHEWMLRMAKNFNLEIPNYIYQPDNPKGMN